MRRTVLQVPLGIERFLCYFLLFLRLENVRSGYNPMERPIVIVNQSGHRVEVHWVPPHGGEAILQSKPFIYNGADLPLNSFSTHTFRVRELPGTRTGTCGDGEDIEECRVGYFTVNDNNDQRIFIREGIIIDHVDDVELARRSAVDLMSSCEEDALNAVSREGKPTENVITDMMSCISYSVTQKISASNEEVSFQANVREGMSLLLENYTCADETLPTTEAKETKKWHHGGKLREVKIMHDREASKIHLIKDFVTEDECKAMEEAAASTLHRAAVADEDGGSTFSESRKAMQAGVTVPWDKEREGHPIAVLSRRVFDYTNEATKFGLEEFGQEELMFIQYEGRGDDDPEPDRYMPHCDGECAGLPFRDGTRVATMVMYCTIPEKGGSTQFMNAGIHIVPERGSAVFFSYMSNQKIMDKGFTRHSGCPVIKGKKQIVTQWMRMGVTSETPWTSYNTLGIKHSEVEE